MLRDRVPLGDERHHEPARGVGDDDGRLAPVHRVDDRLRIRRGAGLGVADRQVDGRHAVAVSLELGPEQVPDPGSRIGAVDEHDVHVPSSRRRVRIPR